MKIENNKVIIESPDKRIICAPALNKNIEYLEVKLPLNSNLIFDPNAFINCKIKDITFILPNNEFYQKEISAMTSEEIIDYIKETNAFFKTLENTKKEAAEKTREEQRRQLAAKKEQRQNIDSKTPAKSLGLPSEKNTKASEEKIPLSNDEISNLIKESKPSQLIELENQKEEIKKSLSPWQKQLYLLKLILESYIRPRNIWIQEGSFIQNYAKTMGINLLPGEISSEIREMIYFDSYGYFGKKLKSKGLDLKREEWQSLFEKEIEKLEEICKWEEIKKESIPITFLEYENTKQKDINTGKINIFIDTLGFDALKEGIVSILNKQPKLPDNLKDRFKDVKEQYRERQKEELNRLLNEGNKIK